MANAQFQVQFNVAGNAGKSIKQLKAEVAELRKRFQEAKQGTDEFVRSGEKLYNFEKDLKAVTNAVKDQRREMAETQKSVELLRVHMQKRESYC